MKKIIILNFILLFTSCAVNYKEKPKQKISLEDKISSLEYKLVLPTTWSPYLDHHNGLSFKPSIYSGNQTDVQLHISHIPPDIHKNLSLKEFVDEKSKKIQFVTHYSSKKTLIQTKFGEGYVLDQKFNANSKTHIIRSTYFKYKGDYYSYSFYSSPSSFCDYIKDYGVIFTSLEFKE